MLRLNRVWIGWSWGGLVVRLWTTTAVLLLSTVLSGGAIVFGVVLIVASCGALIATISTTIDETWDDLIR